MSYQVPPREVVDSLMAAADEFNRRVRTVHERRDCPRCGAPVGFRCVHVITGNALKHSHAARLRADGIAPR